MELQPGLLVGRNVRLTRLLGGGGMGSVWVADHLTLQTEVAVKFISGDLARDPMALKRFTSEATASAQIKSPHVVQVFDHGLFEGLPYIVMELLHGEDLAARIARVRNVRLEETAHIIKQAAKALSQAHANGIVHRDIKPANLFLTDSDGEVFVKLLDFGIAKRVEGDNFAKTATGTMVGTPYYMSPEMVMQGGVVDFRSDLWALAVVVYEALTGTLPFDGASLGAIYVAINSAAYRPVTALCPSLPPDIDRWFAKAFARSAGERFGSAKELADTLMALAQGRTSWENASATAGRSSSLPSVPPFGPAQTSSSPGGIGVGHGGTARMQVETPAGMLTLGGTTSEADQARRKRRFAAVVAGSVGAVGAIIAVLFAVGRSGVTSTPDEPHAGGAPAGVSAGVAPAAAVPTSVPEIAPAAVAPAPSSNPGADSAATPAGGSSASSGSSAASLAPVTPPQGTPKATAKAPATSNTGIPKRRDHGF